MKAALESLFDKEITAEDIQLRKNFFAKNFNNAESAQQIISLIEKVKH